MARGINKVILVGNLGQDPEIRTFPDGGSLANVSIATTDMWKDKQSGEQKEHTEWHRVVFRGGLAGIAGQYLKKGSQVYVEGSIRRRKWQDKEGHDQYMTEIIAFNMTMLSGRGEGGGGGGGGGGGSGGRGGGDDFDQSAQPAAQPAGGDKTSDDFDDDIPF